MERRELASVSAVPAYKARSLCETCKQANRPRDGYAPSIAPEAEEGKPLREGPEKGRFVERSRSKDVPLFALRPLLEQCERLRSARGGFPLSRLSLDEEEQVIFGWGIADGFDLLHTGGAERVKPHTVPRMIEVFAQLCLEQEEIFAREKTLKQGILRPLAVSEQDFVNPGVPLIVRDVIGGDIAANQRRSMMDKPSQYAPQEGKSLLIRTSFYCLVGSC